MTKEVLVSITGLQFDQNGDNGDIEVITRGDYYKKNDKHYVLFEEVAEGTADVTKNVMKFAEHELNLHRKGATNVDMVFDEKRKTLSSYGTPFGNILIGIDTETVSCEEGEDRISLSVDYALEVNYEFLANCKLKVDISSKGSEVNLLN